MKARLLGVSLVALLGASRREVAVYGSGGFTCYDDDQTRAQVDGWLRLGLTQVKIKVDESWGSRPQRDLARARLVREQIGADRDLFVDANGGYQPAQAIRLGQAYDELGVIWFEEPVSSDDPEGLAVVRAAVRADVAAGEYGWDPFCFRRLLESGAVDCLQVDATRCGGVTGFLAAATQAAAHNREVSAHCAPHLHAPMAAAVPNLRHIEYFHDHVRIEEQLLFTGTAPAQGGVLRLGDQPGHGIGVRSDAEARFRVA